MFTQRTEISGGHRQSIMCVLKQGDYRVGDERKKNTTSAPVKRVNIYEMETMWRNFAKLICIPRFA